MAENSEPTETPTDTSAPAAATAETSKSSTPATPASAGAAPASADSSIEAATEQFWRDDWRERIAGTNEKELQQLRRYATPEGIWRKARELEKRLSSGEFKRARPDSDNPEAVAAWRKENGVPDRPEDYLTHLDEGVTIDAEDRPALDRVFARMHALGVPATQANEIVSEYYNAFNEAAQQQLTADREFRITSEDTLRAEWGLRDFRPTVDAIGQLVREHGGDALVSTLMDARTTDGRLLGDSPDVMRFLASIAREVYPDGFIPLTPSGGLSASDETLDQELQKLQFEMTDTRGRGSPDSYWNNEAKQARYRALLTAQEKREARRR